MGMTATEEAILDLADAGLSKRQIAARGFKRSKVRSTIATMGTDYGNRLADQRRDRAVRRGTEQLLKALTAAREAE